MKININNYEDVIEYLPNSHREWKIKNLMVDTLDFGEVNSRYSNYLSRHCNKWYRSVQCRSGDYRCWKRYRKYQYK